MADNERLTKKARDYKAEEKSKWRKSIVLTPAEGKKLEIIQEDNGCNNTSALLKKIANGELELR